MSGKEGKYNANGNIEVISTIIQVGTAKASCAIFINIAMKGSTVVHEPTSRKRIDVISHIRRLRNGYSFLQACFEDSGILSGGRVPDIEIPPCSCRDSFPRALSRRKKMAQIVLIQGEYCTVGERSLM